MQPRPDGSVPENHDDALTFEEVPGIDVVDGELLPRRPE
ncbi:hypothetical protein QE381_001571 [Microbacterium sp. SORGH_AS 888]|nr:hypothetical protein [Microbacterium sp. SORGH_AS_0888]